jgi:transposase
MREVRESTADLDLLPVGTGAGRTGGQAGGRWDQLPVRYGPHQTAYALFQTWRKDGTWERLAAALSAVTEARVIIPWADAEAGTGARADGLRRDSR